MKDEQNTNACLMEARLQFRELLNEHGLPALAGSESETVSWLEQMVIQFADSVARRERFRELIRQPREMLTREQGARPRDGDLPGGERTERPNPHIGRRFRRVRVLQS